MSAQNLISYYKRASVVTALELSTFNQIINALVIGGLIRL